MINNAAGTESLSQEDLITTEQKNIFCAAFPKIASKFEGWNLKSSSCDDDDDEYDGTIRDKANMIEEFCPSNTPGSTSWFALFMTISTCKLTFDFIIHLR